MIIHVCALTTDAKEVGQVEFEICRTCKQDVLLVVEDWNAKVENIEKNYLGLWSKKPK